ncbi:MAG: DUF72 domain-containing protein [Planctomycetes bacterium]|nr:DUF72 domain-containing protein [Planctomycetota bacterium]
MNSNARVLFGTAGWSYPDWNGIVYPQQPPRGFDALRHLASFVDVVEINHSFYRPPTADLAKGWLSSIADLPRFRFTAKLHRGFTHRPPSEWGAEDRIVFNEGLRPLRHAGRLAAVLAQFPFFFDARREHLEHLRAIFDAFAELPLVVELRHHSFDRADILERLHARGISWCTTDQPRSSTSLAFEARATGPIGYVRLHGRNHAAWFAKDAGRDAKYDYLYSSDELASFLPVIRDLVARTETTIVIANNHFQGKAPANALELKAAHDAAKVRVPETLVAAYPRLRAIASNLETDPTDGAPT